MLLGVERNQTVEGWWRCFNAALANVAPRIWQQQYIIMKMCFVSISRYKSNSLGMIGMSRVLSYSIFTLIPVFSCQSCMCFRYICVFTLSNFLCIDVAARGKREFSCDKQVEKVVTVLNCVLKSSWREGGSGGIRKKLKSEYIAYFESKYRRNDGSSI